MGSSCSVSIDPPHLPPPHQRKAGGLRSPAARVATNLDTHHHEKSATTATASEVAAASDGMDVVLLNGHYRRRSDGNCDVCLVGTCNTLDMDDNNDDVVTLASAVGDALELAEYVDTAAVDLQREDFEFVAHHRGASLQNASVSDSAVHAVARGLTGVIDPPPAGSRDTSTLFSSSRGSNHVQHHE